MTTLVATSALLLAATAAPSQATNGYVKAFSTDKKGYANAKLEFPEGWGGKAVRFDPIRVNDRNCNDQEFVYVDLLVRFKGRPAFTKVEEFGISGCGTHVDAFFHTGGKKVDDAGIRVCYGGNFNCSAIDWRDNPLVAG